MRIENLPAKWRQDAGDSDSKLARGLRRCADELERSWHDYRHRFSASPDCPLCRTGERNP